MASTSYHLFPSPTSDSSSADLPSHTSDASDDTHERPQRRVWLDRCHPGTAILGLLLILGFFTSISPFFTSLAGMLVVDAAYTPTFNITDTQYTVTGTGRAALGILPDLYRDSFPVVQVEHLDGNASVATNTTYYCLADNAAYHCQYHVYSTVTRVNSGGFGRDGVKLELTVPGCTALNVARVAVTAYMPLMLVSSLLVVILYGEQLRGAFGCTPQLKMKIWWSAAVCHALLVFFGVVQACAMWTFVTNAAFVHRTINAAMYVQPLLIALVALLAAWNLTSLHQDAQTGPSAATRRAAVAM